MRRTAAFLMLISGVGAGLYLYPRSALEQHATIAAGWLVGAAAPMLDTGTTTGPRIYSPDRPLFVRVPQPDRPGATQAEHRPIAAEPATPVAPGSVPRPQVLASLPQTEQAEREKAQQSKRQLVTDLQRELTRVGCYSGEIDGEWTAAARRSMQTFTERVNARLPLDEPDYILLTLVKGHAAEACGRSCPVGQALAGDGRCVPRALIVKRERARAGAQPTVAAKPANDGTEAGVMTPAKTVPLPVAAVQPPKPAERKMVASSWTTQVVPAHRESFKATETAVAQLIQPTAPLVAPAPVLPGRMTLGAAPLPSASELTVGTGRSAPPASEAPAAKLKRNAAIEPTKVRPSSEAAPVTSAVTSVPSSPSPTPRPTDAVDAEPPAKPQVKRSRSKSFTAPAPVATYRPKPEKYFAPPRQTQTRHWTRTIFNDLNRLH